MSTECRTMNGYPWHSNAGTPAVLGAALCLLSATLNAADSPVGTWRGQSTCQVKASACRDEDSVYRAAAVPKSETRITLSANKIVNGQEVNMGTSECSYSPATHALDCPLPNGNTVRLTLDGDTLNGTMTLADGTAWRKIELRRAPAK
jgi:hypothetical protein